MKILRVTSLGYESGGADNGIALLQPIFKDMGHTVKIMTSNLCPELSHFSDAEFEAIEHRPMFLKLFYRIFNPASYSSLRKVLKEFQPDIVHLHTMREVSASVLYALKHYPTVMTVHGMEDFLPSIILWSFPPSFFTDNTFSYKNLTLEGRFHYFYHRYLGLPFYRIGFKNIDKFVVLSRYMQSQLAKDHIVSQYVRNATELFDSAPIDRKSKLITYVGRLEKAKGIDYLIRAIPEIAKQCPVSLAIAGDGSYKKELQDLVARLHLQKDVSFLGYKNRSELYDLYTRSALVVVPSVWPEPFGKVGIEAMSVGRPVIASDVGGIPEWLVNGKTGYLVRPENSEEIAQKALKLLTNPGLLRKMSLACVKHAKQFDIQIHAKAMLLLYEKVIEWRKIKVTLQSQERNSETNVRDNFSIKRV